MRQAGVLTAPLVFRKAITLFHCIHVRYQEEFYYYH